MADWGRISNRGNVQDRRGFSPVGIGGGLSLGALALLFLFNILTGGSPEDILNQLENLPIEPQNNITREEFEGEDSYEVFASKVLGSNNAMWSSLFSRSGRTYTEPKLVLFRTATQSACGVSTSEVGPHYCPNDKTIYIDETFFDELVRRFGAQGGDVAEAYVIAHEVGHHAQSELGIL
jgi:predicted metalloprotease